MRQILFLSLACADQLELTPTQSSDIAQAIDGLSLTSRVSNFLRGKYPRETQDKSLLSRLESAAEAEEQDATSRAQSTADNLKAFGRTNDGLTRYIYQSSNAGPFGPYTSRPPMGDWMLNPSPMFPQIFPGSLSEFAWFKPIEPAFIGAFPIYKPASMPILAQVSAIGEGELIEATIEEIALPEAEVPTIEDNPVAESIIAEELAKPIEIFADPVAISSPVAADLPSELGEELEEAPIQLAPAAEPRKVIRRVSPSSHALLLESLMQEKAAAEAALAKMQAQIAYYDLMAKQQAQIQPAQPPAPPSFAMNYMQTDAVISDLLKDMFKPLGIPTRMGSPVMNF